MIRKLKGELLDFLKILIEAPCKKLFNRLKNRFVHRRIVITPTLSKVATALDANDRIDWGLAKLGVPDVWRITQGEGIKIAILDTGIALQHPDLKDAIVEAVDFTTDRNPMDLNGHGSHVAGIIGARMNGLGVVGVAPMCQLYSGKVLNAQGQGDFSWIVSGILWAIDKKVDIINMSLGGPSPYSPMYNALKKAYDSGIVIVVAAGNEGEVAGQDTIGYPARYDETIAVGSVSPTLDRSQYSSVGRELDIVAPGGQIYSCWPPANYAILSGTSMASPFISGICALILAENRKVGGIPIKNGKDMLDRLKLISKHASGPEWDPETGYGIVDPEKIPGLK